MRKWKLYKEYSATEPLKICMDILYELECLSINLKKSGLKSIEALKQMTLIKLEDGDEWDNL